MKQHEWLESHLTDLVGRLCEKGLLPQVRRQVAVSLWDGIKGSLGCRRRNQRWAGAQGQHRKLLFHRSVRYWKGEQRRPQTVFLPCITIPISFSPDNDNATTAEVRLSRARRKKKKKDTGHSHYTRLTKVSKGSCAAPGGGVAVINTGHHEQLLGHRSRHDSSTTGGRDETHQDWATAARHLAGYGVRLTNLVTPITSPDRDNRQLGKDDCPTDGCGHLFGALHSQTHVTIVVTNGNKGL